VIYVTQRYLKTSINTKVKSALCIKEDGQSIQNFSKSSPLYMMF